MALELGKAHFRKRVGEIFLQAIAGPLVSVAQATLATGVCC